MSQEAPELHDLTLSSEIHNQRTGFRTHPVRPSWHILITEKTPGEALFLEEGLRRHGHTVHVAETGAAALNYGTADLMLLDLDLPDMDGVDLCRDIRATSETPLLIVTARDSEVDRVLGLQAGADDYLSKPYSFRELLARMEAVMRRAAPPAPVAESLTLGGLTIEAATRTVKVCGADVPVTRKEFDLLHLLATKPGLIISRRQILRQVWDDPGNSRSRTLDTHINSLRSKLGSSQWITTVRGVGFRLGCS
ncbi:response regulator transcription factor [Streptomyces sp. NPDC055189]